MTVAWHFTETVRPPADVPEKAQMEQSEKEENRLQKRRKHQKLVQQAENLRATFGSMRLTGKYERLVKTNLLEFIFKVFLLYALTLPYCMIFNTNL